MVTTINPYSNMDYQLACFRGWRERGYRVVSFNNKYEKELLLQHNLDSDDLVEIQEEETALDLFGKAVPRILPLLARSAGFGAENIILVNSDIYPGHSQDISEYLGSISNAIAMTRSDFIAQPKVGYSGDTHYRGGLDIFFFTANGLKALLDDLIEIPVAARMTFGVPGWDFFLGHQLIHVHSGVIMDGAVMFHRHHKTSYSDVQEFDSYSRYLFDSGIYRNSSGIDLVSEFSSTIQEQCIRNAGLSRKLSDQFYKALKLDYENSVQSEGISSIYKRYLLLRKKFSIRLKNARERLAPFIDNQSQGEYWEGAVFFKNTQLSDMSHVEGYLLVLLIAMLVKDSRSDPNLTTVYPVGNLHGEVLNRIIEAPGTEGIEAEVLKLFASELVDYSIFNMDLFKYIALSSRTRRSLALCNGVLLLCQKGLVRSTGNYYYLAPSLAYLGNPGLEDSFDGLELVRCIGMTKDADYIKSARLSVVQYIDRLVQGGIGDIRVAAYMLSFFENMLMPGSPGTDENGVYSHGLLSKPIRQYIDNQKDGFLEEDLQKLA